MNDNNLVNGVERLIELGWWKSFNTLQQRAEKVFGLQFELINIIVVKEKTVPIISSFLLPTSFKRIDFLSQHGSCLKKKHIFFYIETFNRKLLIMTSIQLSSIMIMFKVIEIWQRETGQRYFDRWVMICYSIGWRNILRSWTKDLFPPIYSFFVAFSPGFLI